MVFRVLSYQRPGSRSVRMTFASGYASDPIRTISGPLPLLRVTISAACRSDQRMTMPREA